MKWAIADMGSFGRFGFAPHERKLGYQSSPLAPSQREKQRQSAGPSEEPGRVCVDGHH